MTRCQWRHRYRSSSKSTHGNGGFWWGFVYPSASTRPSFVSRSTSTALPCKIYITALYIVCFPALHALVGGVSVLAALFVALRVFLSLHSGQDILGAHSTKLRVSILYLYILPKTFFCWTVIPWICCCRQLTPPSIIAMLHWASVLLDRRIPSDLCTLVLSHGMMAHWDRAKSSFDSSSCHMPYLVWYFCCSSHHAGTYSPDSQ